MPSITVKNIPPEVYERLKQSAKANRRSLNSEIIVCLEQAFKMQPMVGEDRLERFRLLRERMGNYLITNEEINEAKRAGRP